MKDSRSRSPLNGQRAHTLARLTLLMSLISSGVPVLAHQGSAFDEAATGAIPAGNVARTTGYRSAVVQQDSVQVIPGLAPAPYQAPPAAVTYGPDAHRTVGYRAATVQADSVQTINAGSAPAPWSPPAPAAPTPPPAPAYSAPPASAPEPCYSCEVAAAPAPYYAPAPAPYYPPAPAPYYPPAPAPQPAYVPPPAPAPSYTLSPSYWGAEGGSWSLGVIDNNTGTLVGYWDSNGTGWGVWAPMPAGPAAGGGTGSGGSPSYCVGDAC